MSSNTSQNSSSSSSLTSICSTILTSFTDRIVPTVAAESKEAKEEDPAEEDEEDEEEDEEEPEDCAPAIREECTESKCSKYKHHFDHCQERVQGGQAEKGEDCVEEFFHLLHCVDGCATPQVFSKLV